MPWTIDRPPAAMKNLPPPIRAHAVRIANAVLAAGADEGRAIRIGIAQARRAAGIVPLGRFLRRR